MIFDRNIPNRMPPSSSSQMLRPVRIALREGAQEGAAVKACLNRTPSLAIRSRAGVLVAISPYAPACIADWSSEITNKTFGRSDWEKPRQEINRNRKMNLCITITNSLYFTSQYLACHLTCQHWPSKPARYVTASRNVLPTGHLLLEVNSKALSSQ